MLRNRDEWLMRIKEVERQYQAVRAAVDSRLNSPASYAEGIGLRDLSRAAESLEGTFIVRLFAEFETGLRQYWNTLKHTHPKMEDLLNSIGNRRRIPEDLITLAHSTRKYRNALIHERDDTVDPVSIARVRGNLCRFLSHLPPSWE